MTEVPPSLLRRERSPRAEGRLTLLDAFELNWDGRTVELPTPAQRLLAYLAIEDRLLHRSYVADTLWLNSTGNHASGSLRSALWRIRRTGCELVEERSHQLRLVPNVAVDLREAYARSSQFQNPELRIGTTDVAEASASAELLRDWYDDWVVFERERFRQFRAHALELLCARLATEGRFADAIEVGLAAVRNEPLRESAHRAVISVHLAEGNRSEALRQYAYYRQLVNEELGIEPSTRMETLVRAG